MSEETLKTKEVVDEGKKTILSVSMTKKGAFEFLEIIQNHVGYIEEESHEQIINDVTVWMNANYGQLLEFYINSVEKGLVPADQHIGIRKENTELHAKNEELKSTIVDLKAGIENIKGKFLETRKQEKKKKKEEEENDKFKPLTEMKLPELKKLASSLEIPVSSGMKKDMLIEMIQEESSKRGQVVA